MTEDMRYIVPRANGKYQVRITRDGQQVTIGTYPNLDAARMARNLALAELGKATFQAEAKAEPKPAAQPDWEAVGVSAAEMPDENEVYQRAVDAYRQTAILEMRKRSQRLVFHTNPVCMVYIGDVHFAGRGTDVERAFEEAQIIAETPGMYAATMGDMLDQFIQAFFSSIRLDGHFSITDEWVLLKKYLTLLAPKLAVSVGGNHDFWARQLSGVDWVREVFGALAPHVIYDAHDVRVVLDVCGVEFPGRMRHSWKGYSIYNETHGIERAAKFDDRDFIWGIGAHSHRAGLARQFTIGSQDGIAVLVGTYKRIDDYARQKGFPKPNDSTAVAVIFDAETRSMTGYNNLEQAAKVMRALRGQERKAA